MSKLTTTQKTQIKSIPQQTILHLSIYQPNTIMSCRINNSSITRNARVIAYDSITFGSYTNVVSGMTMLVGTTPGASDIGRVRIRRATSTTFTVGENSDVWWVNNAYITVVDFIDIMPIFPRILLPDPSKEDQFVFYKDYDVAYSGQNKKLGSLICAGPHRAGTLDENTGSTRFYYSASGSSHVSNDSLTYYWEFPGADGVTGSYALTPGYITYKTPGHYATKITVSGTSTQSSDYSYRYVSIYDHNNLPTDWEFTGLQTSRSANGASTSITINSPWKFGNIYDNAIVVIYSDEWYGDTKVNIGGNAENNDNIFFVGYIMKDSIKWDYEKSSVTFDVQSVSEMMKKTAGFSTTLEDEQTVTDWYQISQLNLKKSLYHYLRWHSTVLLTTDFQFIATDRNIQFFDSDRESVFDAIEKVVKSSIMGEVVVDRQGKIWVEDSMEATNLAFTAYPSHKTFDSSDFIGEPTIEENTIKDTAYIEIGGINYEGGASKKQTAYLSCAPGKTPGVRGKVDSPDGLAITGQTQLNKLAGDLYAYRNAKIPNIRGDLRGGYKFLDVVPMEGYLLHINANENSKNMYISGTYFVEDVTWNYDAETQYLGSSVSFRQITQGVIGESRPIPKPPGGPSIKVPPFKPPVIPIPPSPGQIPPPLAPLTDGVLTVLMNGQLFYTQIPTELDADQPVWVWHSAPTGTDQYFTDFEMNIYGQVMAVNSSVTGSVWFGMYNELKQYVVGIETFKPLVYDVNFNPFGHYTVSAIGVQYDQPDSFAFAMRDDGAIAPAYGANGFQYLVGASSLTPSALKIPNFKGGSYTNSDGDWSISYQYGLADNYMFSRYSPDLSTLETFHALPGTYGGYAYHVNSGKTGLYRPMSQTPYIYTNEDFTEVLFSTIAFNSSRQSFDIDPSGTHYMAAQVRPGGTYNISVTTLPETGWLIMYITEQIPTPLILNLGGSEKWVMALKSGANPADPYKIMMTEDFGVHWYDITGLLSLVIGTHSIDAMRMVNP